MQRHLLSFVPTQLTTTPQRHPRLAPIGLLGMSFLDLRVGNRTYLRIEIVRKIVWKHVGRNINSNHLELLSARQIPSQTWKSTLGFWGSCSQLQWPTMQLRSLNPEFYPAQILDIPGGTQGDRRIHGSTHGEGSLGVRLPPVRREPLVCDTEETLPYFVNRREMHRVVDSVLLKFSAMYSNGIEILRVQVCGPFSACPSGVLACSSMPKKGSAGLLTSHNTELPRVSRILSVQELGKGAIYAGFYDVARTSWP